MNSKLLVRRKQNGLTQQDLATKAGVNQADIVRIERHDWIPPAPVRQRIAKALHSTEQTLFGESR